MSISFFWLERGGRWYSSPSTSPADHQNLNVIQKWAFHFFWLERGGRWDLSPLISLANHQMLNVIQKMSISFFWLERGGRWGSSPSTSPADHKNLNVIQKWAFQFYGWREVVDGVWVHRPAQPIIRSWTSSKNEHFIFLAGEGWPLGFESIDQPNWSLDIKHNPKMNISFFWLERGGRWLAWPIIRIWT